MWFSKSNFFAMYQLVSETLNCFCNKSVSSFLHCKILLPIKKYDFPYIRKIFSNYLLIASSFYLLSVKRLPYKNLEGLKQTFNFFFLHKLHLHFTTQKLRVVFFIDDWTHSTAILRLLTKKATSSTRCIVIFRGNGAKIYFVDKTRQFCRPLHYIDLTLQLIFSSEETCKTPFQPDGHCIAALITVWMSSSISKVGSIWTETLWWQLIPLKWKNCLSISITFKTGYNKTSYFYKKRSVFF